MKKTLKVSTVGFLGVVTFTLLFIQYIKSDFNQSFRNSDIESIHEEIKSAKELPDQFVKVYNENHPITSTSGILFDWTFSEYNRDCPCLHVASLKRELLICNNRVTGNRFILALKLEKEVTQQQCLNYLASQFDFLYNNIGIEDASRFYFNNTVDSLTKKQMKTFVLMFRNPNIYKPNRNLDDI